ncbi:MAG: oxygenase MpaB family protein [Gemmatimonadota bacterium]|nr:oxygenase MpaB family protein [Gemmatimonadota bacterium]
MNIPSAYAAGYEAARARDPRLAEAYIRHTTIGDPLADAVIRDLGSLSPEEIHDTLAEVLEGPEVSHHGVPDSLLAFVEEAGRIPGWFDGKRARIASQAFLRNSDIVLAALVGGSIVEGFSTLISKSFRIRGRLVVAAIRRLKHNGMQLVEQYLPGGMEPGGDGWRLTLRARLVHAQSRHLLNGSDEWDRERYGTPLSAAHILLAGAAFSGRLMGHVAALGGDFTRDEREAFVHVWRYAGVLFGIIMANSVVNSAPIIVGVKAPPERRKMARTVTQVSRELIGDELADSLRFPRRKRKIVPWLRFRHRARRTVGRMLPGLAAKQNQDRFEALMEFASFDEFEHSYRLPTALHDERSSDW